MAPGSSRHPLAESKLADIAQPSLHRCRLTVAPWANLVREALIARSARQQGGLSAGAGDVRGLARAAPLERLYRARAQGPRCSAVITDNASYHHSRIRKDGRAQRAGRFGLSFLRRRAPSSSRSIGWEAHAAALPPHPVLSRSRLDRPDGKERL